MFATRMDKTFTGCVTANEPCRSYVDTHCALFSKPNAVAMDDATYRADVDARSFDITVADNTLHVDETGHEVSVARVGNGYLSLVVDGQSLSAAVEPLENDRYRVTINGRMTEVHVKDERAMLLEEFGLEPDAGAGEREVRAPMPGLVLDVLVEEGDTVAADEGLVVLEAMKMENELAAPAAGTVATIHATQGDAVEKNALLIELDLDA